MLTQETIHEFSTTNNYLLIKNFLEVKELNNIIK